MNGKLTVVSLHQSKLSSMIMKLWGLLYAKDYVIMHMS